MFLYTSLFHGKFKSPSGCDVAVIRAIHKNMQTVAYRFNSGLEKCFEDVFTMFESHPTLIDNLTDKGSNKVSRKYLAAWEKGFRAAALVGYVMYVISINPVFCPITSSHDTTLSSHETIHLSSHDNILSSHETMFTSSNDTTLSSHETIHLSSHDNILSSHDTMY